MIFRPTRFSFCPFWRTPPAFSTILPFYLGSGSSFFQP